MLPQLIESKIPSKLMASVDTFNGGRTMAALDADCFNRYCNEEGETFSKNRLDYVNKFALGKLLEIDSMFGVCLVCKEFV